MAAKVNSNLPSSKLSLDLSLKLSDLGGGRLSALNQERGFGGGGGEGMIMITKQKKGGTAKIVWDR